MQDLPASVRPGEHVDVRSEPWQVVHTERFDNVTVFTLRGIGPCNHGTTQSILSPFDRVAAASPRTGLVRTTRRGVLRTAATALRHLIRWSECWTVGSAKIDVRPWQFEPAIAAVRGASRLLLADEVGLGKTIQALLIVSELCARGLARRSLILTPASLREQWAAEMSGRFGMGATVFDRASLAAMATELPVGVNPWKTAPHVITSIDLIKREDVRAALDEVPIDILIVDEAHHLIPGTDRGRVVATLGARAVWVVLLTATPHSGDAAAYDFLQALGNVDGEPIRVFRRRAQDVRPAASRRVRLFPVAPSSAERRLLDETFAYARALWSNGRASAGVQLLAGVVARRAASMPDAARRTLARRRELLSGTPLPVLVERINENHGDERWRSANVSRPFLRNGRYGNQPDIPLDPTLPWLEDEPDDAVDDAALSVPGLPDHANELAWLDRLLGLAAEATTVSSKIHVVRRLLRRTTEPLIVFSEYRDVVEAAADCLRDLSTCVVLHGGLSARARQEVVADFTGGHVRTLLTTDAAGEGLNLQQNCRLVVNLELPWNPLRLDQRVGRVDRFGQTRPVHALCLFHPNSFEEIVLARFEQRRARANEELDALAGRSHEVAMAASVFGPTPTPRGDARLSMSTGPRRLAVHSLDDDLQKSRALEGPVDRWSIVTSYATRGIKHHPVRALVLLFAVDLADAHGRLVQQEAIPLRVEWKAGGRFSIRLTAAAVREAKRHADVRVTLDNEVGRRIVAASSEIVLTADALERRIAGIRDADARSGAPQLFQASLFDARAEEHARARQAGQIARQADLARHWESARALRSLSHTAPRLLTAWLAW